MNGKDFDFNELEDDFEEEKKEEIIMIDETQLHGEDKIIFVKNETQINVMKETMICLKFKNVLSQPTCLSVENVLTETFSIEFYPRKLLIERNETKDITIIVKPFCSVHIDYKVNINVNNEFWGYFEFIFTTGPSLWINSQFLQGLDAKKVIGRGTFGIVFEGVYNSMKCAIKRINGCLDLIEKELQIITSLRNPFLVQCYGMVYYSSTIHIVMELAPHGSFDQYLKEMNYEIKMKILLDVLKGIQFLHRNNIIHRDIKPANVVLFNIKNIVEINAKLTDFGSSTLRDENKMTGGVGTIAYMAPEVMKMEMYGFECDIYSFGMMFYEVISQRELFSGMKSYEIKRYILEGKRPKQTAVISSRIYSIIEGCWCDDCKKRWGCDELIELIQKVRSGTNEMMVNPTPKIEKHGCILAGIEDGIINQSTLAYFIRKKYEDKEETKGWYFIAKKLIKKNKMVEAKELLTKGVEKRSVCCMKLMVKIMLKEGKINEAVDLLIDCCYENDVESEEKLVRLMDEGIELNEERLNKYLEYLVINGNKEATFELAKRYMYKKPINFLKSERLLRQLVIDDYPGAAVQLGLLLFMMQEDLESNKMALELFNKASLKGDENGMNNCGVFYSLGYGSKKDIQKAIQMFNDSSSRGCGIAENNKGVLLFNGSGAENEIKDITGAAQCFIKSSEKGCKEGMFNAAVCYFNGDGVDKDDLKAVDYLKRAAELGDAEAESLLASCYKYGRGVEVNPELSVKWTLKAANDGSGTAMFNVGCWYYLGENVQMNKKKAVEWYVKSAKESCGNAMCNLGRCYFDGEGVEPNKREAAKWFKKSAKKGIVIGQFNIANCYYYGDGVKKSIEKCIYWSKIASMNGHAKAFVLYGKCLLMYYQFEEAKSVFEEANNLNVSEGKWYLGLLYENGIGGIKDQYLALKYYTEASKEWSCAQEKIGIKIYKSEGKIDGLKAITKRSDVGNQIVGKELMEGKEAFGPSEGTYLLFQSAKMGNENAFNYLLESTEMKDEKVIGLLNNLYYNCLNEEQKSGYDFKENYYSEIL